MIEKVISGGQTGADQAGLRAAVKCGISTGGWLPNGCITLAGADASLLDRYGMMEHTGGYAVRTEANVKDSDGTVRFAKTFKSAGEKCTLRAIKWFGRPYFDVDAADPPDHDDMVNWILDNNIKTLNVAGNAEETASGIGDFVYEYLIKVFSDVRIHGLKCETKYESDFRQD